jgi:hypothetical protein
MWTVVANAMLQLFVSLDGKQIGSGQTWSNQNTTHRVLPTLFIPCDLTYGSHELTLTLASNGATSDLNDSFSASLIY